MSVYWIPMIGIIGSFCVAIAIVSITSASKTKRAQLRADVQMKLIDKFGSATEFVSFVSSEEGKQFLGDAPRVARANFIGGIRNGIIMLCIGIGFIVVGFTEHDHGWFIPGFILLGVGLGFFVSAVVTMKLSQQFDNDNRRNMASLAP